METTNITVNRNLDAIKTKLIELGGEEKAIFTIAGGKKVKASIK